MDALAERIKTEIGTTVVKPRRGQRIDLRKPDKVR
jgi:hypothetical protein